MPWMTLIVVAVLLALVAGAIYARWLDAEERKAEQAKFQRIAQANSESVNWPPPSGPKGFDRNRKGTI